MQKGLDVTRLSFWAALGERAGEVDARGAFFNQKHVVAALEYYAKTDEYRSLVEKMRQ